MLSVYAEHLSRASCPEAVGVDSDAVAGFIRECDERGYNLKNLMIMRRGKVAAACTRYPYDADVPHTMFSFSKILTSIAIGFAITEGLLRLDTSIEEIFSDKYDEKIFKNSEGITVEHLLTMTAGKKLSILDNKEKTDWLYEYIKAKPKYKPGEEFLYVSENPYILGRMLTAVTGLNITEYLTPRLFVPLSIDVPFWESDSEGYQAGGWGLFLKIEDMAKIAQCYLQKGMWHDIQVIPREWIETSVTPKYMDMYSLYAQDLGFGYQIWCGRADGYYRFEGLYGQSAFMYPNQDACIVVNGGGILQKDLYDLIDKYFPAAFRDNLELPEPEKEEEFRAFLDSVTYKVLKPEPRNFATEKGISANTYKMMKKRYATVQSAACAFVMALRPGDMDNIKLEFFENYALYTWTEKNYGKNTIAVSLDGQRRISLVRLGENEMQIAAYGSWRTDNKLNIQIIPLAVPEVRNFILTFKGKHLKINMDVRPRLCDMIQFKLLFEGVKPNKFWSLLAKLGGRLGSLVFYPSCIRGRKIK